VSGPIQLCVIDGCDLEKSASAGQGMCRPHYSNKMRTGDPKARFKEKPCKRCNETYAPFSMGSKMCVKCRAYVNSKENTNARGAKWRAEHPGYSSDCNAKWRAANPELRKAYNDKYRLEHKGAIKAAYAKWAELNPEYSSEWAKLNVEKTRLGAQRRRAVKNNAQTFRVTERDRRRALSRLRGCCTYCGVNIIGGYVAWDHIIPLAAGGTHGIGNLTPSCRRCNSQKSSYLLVQWLYLSRLKIHPKKSTYADQAFL